MQRRWGFPVFADSHPIDALYARICSAHGREDWPAVVAAGRRRNRLFERRYGRDARRVVGNRYVVFGRI